jgi:hypothetical protein
MPSTLRAVPAVDAEKESDVEADDGAIEGFVQDVKPN